MSYQTVKILSTAFTICLTTCASFAADNVPVLPDTRATVVIGDLPGLLDKAGDLASLVMPGMNGSMLKQQAGMLLGDPNLEGLPAGSGIAVIIPNEGMPFAFLEVSASKLDDYEKLAKERGASEATQAEGLLVAGPDADSVKTAKTLASKVKSDILGGNGSPTLAGSVKLADLLEKYEPQITEGMKGIAEKLDSAAESTATSTQKEMLSSALAMYVALGKNIETLEVSVGPSSKGLEMNYTITPAGEMKPSVEPEGQSGSDLLKLLPGTGAMRIELTANSKSWSDVMASVAAAIAKEVKASDSAAKEFKSWMEDFAKAYTGSMAMIMMTQEKQPFSAAYALGVRDEEAALKFLVDMPAKMESSGLNSLYKAMGITMTVKMEKDASKYKETPIHRLTMNMEFENQPEAQAKRMKEMFGNQTFDVAIVNKTLLYGIKPVTIESLIDAVKSGSNPQAKPLISKSGLPEGGAFYADYNIAAVMAMGMQMTPASNPAASKTQEMFASIKDAPPVQIGGYSKEGEIQITTLVPAGLIKAFAQASQKASSSGSSTGDSEVKAPKAGAKKAPKRSAE